MVKKYWMFSGGGISSRFAEQCLLRLIGDEQHEEFKLGLPRHPDHPYYEYYRIHTPLSTVEDAKAAAVADDRESKIRERAHRIWQEEGSPEGRAHSHWHQAQKEIDAEEAARKLSELKGD